MGSFSKLGMSLDVLFNCSSEIKWFLDPDPWIPSSGNSKSLGKMQNLQNYNQLLCVCFRESLKALNGDDKQLHRW